MAGGACMAEGGMCGEGAFVAGGHAWVSTWGVAEGGMHGREGMHGGRREHAWQCTRGVCMGVCPRGVSGRQPPC